MTNPAYNCLVILGPTASGKTSLACKLALQFNGEIISADSRQVYKYLNIGTGKDLHEYTINQTSIPYHLIDICEPDEQFYLGDFNRLLKTSFLEITRRRKLPIICGGTGLYLEAIANEHHFTSIPENTILRMQLAQLSKDEIQKLYQQQVKSIQVNYQIDLNSSKRMIRGLEILEYLKTNPMPPKEPSIYKPKYLGVKIDREKRNARIDKRLKHRLENGLIEEVQTLIANGLSHERLQFLGLEYKFISLYLLGQLNKQELYTQLSTAIHQFAKRQMTWFRRMEKKGVEIEWIDAATFDINTFLI